MTMQKNRRLIAVPNVLRDQTVPNTLGGRRETPVARTRLQLPVRTIAIWVGAAIALLYLLLGGRS